VGKTYRRGGACLSATVVAAALLTAPTGAGEPSAAGPPVTYTAQVALRGLKVTVPSRQWTIYEDQRGEFSLRAPRTLTDQGYIHFWLDPHASAPRGVVLTNVGTTPNALIRWLRGNKHLVVSPPTTRRIGSGLTMKTVRLDLSAGAPKEDPSCRVPCLTYFVFNGPGYNFPFGTARGEPVRLYLASVKRGGPARTLAIAVSAPTRAFPAIESVSRKILASVVLPATLTTG
jgi:hypothetical protein